MWNAPDVEKFVSGCFVFAGVVVLAATLIGLGIGWLIWG